MVRSIKVFILNIYKKLLVSGSREICGILHSSMPIVIQSVSLEKFIAWLAEQQ